MLHARTPSLIFCSTASVPPSRREPFILIRDLSLLTKDLKHAFDVIRSAGSTNYNYKNPVRRDVVSLGGATDNVTIRFRTDNPGPWILHW